MSYLSKITCKEFTHVTASRILDQIICEMDSTPDISQSLILCYVLPTISMERFVLEHGRPYR